MLARDSGSGNTNRPWHHLRPPMSTPTRELENLNLGDDMERGVSNRVLGQRRRRQRQREEQQQLQQAQRQPFQRLAPAPPSAMLALPGGIEPPSQVLGDSGTTYRIRDLTPPSRQTAEESLTNRDRFLIEQSHRIEGSYLAFQLGGGVSSVRVYPPGDPYRRVTCACDAFRRHGGSIICEHIYVRPPRPALLGTDSSLTAACSGYMTD